MKNRTKLTKALVLTFALVACLGMLFTSCGGDEGGTTVTTAPITQPTTTPTTVNPSASTNPGTTDTSAPGTTDTSAPGTTDTSSNKPEDGECTEHKGGTATCTAKAVCEVCGAEYGELASHTEETVAGKAATCTEAGLTDGKKCSVCGETLTAQEEIPAVAHVYDNKIKVVAPSCISDGYTLYGCSAGNCGTTEKADIVTGVVAHSYELADGLEKYDVLACTGCGARMINITTGVVVVEDVFCMGDCGATDDIPCSCETTVEYKAYIAPNDPEAIEAGVTFVKAQAEGAEFEIGGGTIKLVSDEDASYTITIGEDVIEVSGTEVFVELYEYESVTSVTIVSDADATVVFYKPFV